MVFIHVKHSVQHQFLLECSCSSPIREATELAARVHNSRLRLITLLEHAAGLVSDSTPELSTLCVEALELVSLRQPSKKRAVTVEEFDVLQNSLVSQIQGECPLMADGDNAVQAEQAGLWLIGRLRPVDDLLSAHIGTNEKTTVSAVLAQMPLGQPDERKAIKQDMELEGKLADREEDLHKLFKSHAGEQSTEPPTKQQKTTHSTDNKLQLSSVCADLAPLDESRGARLRSCEYVREMVRDKKLQKVSATSSPIEDGPTDIRLAVMLQVMTEILANEEPKAALDNRCQCSVRARKASAEL